MRGEAGRADLQLERAPGQTGQMQPSRGVVGADHLRAGEVDPDAAGADGGAGIARDDGAAHGRAARQTDGRRLRVEAEARSRGEVGVGRDVDVDLVVAAEVLEEGGAARGGRRALAIRHAHGRARDRLRRGGVDDENAHAARRRKLDVPEIRRAGDELEVAAQRGARIVRDGEDALAGRYPAKLEAAVVSGADLPSDARLSVDGKEELHAGSRERFPFAVAHRSAHGRAGMKNDRSAECRGHRRTLRRRQLVTPERGSERAAAGKKKVDRAIVGGRGDLGAAVGGEVERYDARAHVPGSFAVLVERFDHDVGGGGHEERRSPRVLPIADEPRTGGAREERLGERRHELGDAGVVGRRRREKRVGNLRGHLRRRPGHARAQNGLPLGVDHAHADGRAGRAVRGGRRRAGARPRPEVFVSAKALRRGRLGMRPLRRVDADIVPLAAV